MIVVGCVKETKKGQVHLGAMSPHASNECPRLGGVQRLGDECLEEVNQGGEAHTGYLDSQEYTCSGYFFAGGNDTGVRSLS